jgi:hypothetical protein
MGLDRILPMQVQRLFAVSRLVADYCATRPGVRQVSSSVFTIASEAALLVFSEPPTRHIFVAAVNVLKS